MDSDRSAVVLLLASLVAVTGCERKSTGNVVAKDSTSLVAKVIYTDANTVTVKLGLSPTSFHPSAVAVADKYGFFRAEGIRMQYVNVPPGVSPAIEALKKGDIDVFAGGTGHIDGFIDARLAGVKVKAVLAESKGHPNFPHDSAWVAKDSPIQEPKDLVGKRVGGLQNAGWSEGCRAFFWGEYFKKNGIDPATVTNAAIPPDQQEEALRQGRIDVITVDATRQGAIADSGNYRQIWSSWDITEGDVIDKQDAEISLLGFTEDYLQKHADVVRRYVRATAKAQAFTADNLENYVHWTALGDHQKVERDHRNLQVWSTGLIRPRALQKWIDWKVGLGQLKVGQIKPEDLFTNDFNPYKDYKVNDPVANPTYWDTLPREYLYIGTPTKAASPGPSANPGPAPSASATL